MPGVCHVSCIKHQTGVVLSGPGIANRELGVIIIIIIQCYAKSFHPTLEHCILLLSLLSGPDIAYRELGIAISGPCTVFQ